MILITGASSGIGEACALEWGGMSSMMLIARRAEKLNSLKMTIQKMNSQSTLEIHKQFKIQTQSLDLADLKKSEIWMRSHSEFPDHCKIAVLNAGLAKGMKPIQNLEWSEAEEMIQVNLLSVIQWSRWLIHGWVKSGTKGHLVLMGSVAGRWNYPNGNVYAATKAAVHSLAESIRLDVLGSGIRVTEILPGMVETEFSEVRLGDLDKAKAVYRGMRPLTARDIAKSVVWATQQPEHINIQELVIYPTDQASPNHVFRR